MPPLCSFWAGATFFPFSNPICSWNRSLEKESEQRVWEWLWLSHNQLAALALVLLPRFLPILKHWVVCYTLVISLLSSHCLWDLTPDHMTNLMTNHVLFIWAPPLCQSSPSSLLETRIVFADDTRVALSPYQPWEWVHFLQFTHHYTSDKLHIVNMQIGSTTSWRWRWCWLWRQKPVIMGSRWVVMGIEDPRRGLGPKPLITRWKLTKWRGSKWGDKAPHSLLNRNCINILHSIEWPLSRAEN